jgi:hypothetical protein
MRTLRLALAGTITLALLGGVGGAGIAQHDEELPGTTVTPFTGLRMNELGDPTTEEWSEEGSIGRSRGYELRENVEWSDQRLPAEKLNVINYDIHDLEAWEDAAIAGTTLLEGPDGYWSGEWTALCKDGCHGMHVITGHGAYEGLFAVFRGFPPEDEGLWAYEGLIFEGSMPPMPDPVEPSAE